MDEIDKLKIESGIPIPTSYCGLRELIRKMKIGDSFVSYSNPHKRAPSIRKWGFKLKVRKLKAGGWRAWRIK